MTTLKTIVLVTAGLYLCILIIGYMFQSKLIFLPERLSKSFAFKSRGKEIWLSTSDGKKINALFFEGYRPEVILYFHGNAGSLNGWQFIANDFVQLGYSVLIIDYRGYGKSEGEISESGFYADADAAYEYARKTFTANNIIVYGRSIGTGVAIDLCTRTDAAALVLESAYTSMMNLGKQKLPWLLPQLLLRTKFNNEEKIRLVKCPVLFIHGSEDALIPPSESSLLFNACRSEKKLVLIRGGGHNDLNSFAEYHDTIKLELPELMKR
jgi:uncharacterized protein